MTGSLASSRMVETSTCSGSCGVERVLVVRGRARTRRSRAPTSDARCAAARRRSGAGPRAAACGAGSSRRTPPARSARRQLAVDEQPGDLEVGGVLRQLLDRIAAVAQDPLVAVDEGDRGLRRRGVDEAVVERREPRLAGELRDVDARGTLGGGEDREVGGATRVADARGRLVRHRSSLSALLDVASRYAWGGSAATTGWSFGITPTFAAPPGDPTSSKNSTLAL